MKKKTRLILAFVMIAMTALAFAGCGQTESKTLEDYLAENDEARQEIEDSMNSGFMEDMEFGASYEGNNITIMGTLTNTYDDDTLDAVTKSFDENEAALRADMQDAIAQMEESTGISGISVDVVIRNGDTREIWKQHYTR